MINSDEIFDKMFDFNINEGLFCMNNDDEMSLLVKNNVQSAEVLRDFINSNFDSDTRKKLNSLIEQKNDKYNMLVSFQEKFYYKCGVKDGISLSNLTKR